MRLASTARVGRICFLKIRQRLERKIYLHANTCTCSDHQVKNEHLLCFFVKQPLVVTS